MKIRKVNGKYILSGNPNFSLVNNMYLEAGGELDVEITLVDVRKITGLQRKTVFLLCKEVELNTGINRELFRKQMMIQNTKQNAVYKSSLSEYSQTEARYLLDLIIEYFIENELPLELKILKDLEYKFTQTQIYAMILKRQCCVCGKWSHIHHVDKIQMGRNRHKISHLGMRVLPLCPTCHNEVHTIGDDKFMNKYQVTPVVVDETLEDFIKKGIIPVHKEDLKEMEK